MDALLLIPADAIRRKLRERILNSLTVLDEERKCLPVQLSAAVRLVQLPHANCELVRPSKSAAQEGRLSDVLSGDKSYQNVEPCRAVTCRGARKCFGQF